ncbi:hypothetical protein NDU88_009927 [Pleurodeles waltl]|uniref:Uncharacterized protein n=1 Tax=Pleurodeles waltl TaxID=8319 RepID=A0AAV7PTG5_PLEWA|nr:hypothetical protein NDU88_009927 [Pleurodeles waltl]
MEEGQRAKRTLDASEDNLIPTNKKTESSQGTTQDNHPLHPPQQRGRTPYWVQKYTENRTQPQCTQKAPPGSSPNQEKGRAKEKGEATSPKEQKWPKRDPRRTPNTQQKRPGQGLAGDRRDPKNAEGHTDQGKHRRGSKAVPTRHDPSNSLSADCAMHRTGGPTEGARK